jgi:hypothetical protein
MPDFEPVIREKPMGATDLIDVEVDRLKARQGGCGKVLLLKDPVSIPLDHEQGI